MIHIGTWAWGTKYPSHYVERLSSGVARNLKQPFRWHEWRPEDEDEHLTRIQGCFARLRTFDPQWQARQGIEPGDRIVCLDLDLVVTGPLDRVIEVAKPFAILQGVNSSNPNPFNGSVWMLDAGHRPDVWSDFSVSAASRVPYYAFPDDQAWFHYKVPEAGRIGAEHGVYAFQKPGWPKGCALPTGACIVAFPGHRDPGQFQHLDWVRSHWRQ